MTTRLHIPKFSFLRLKNRSARVVKGMDLKPIVFSRAGSNPVCDVLFFFSRNSFGGAVARREESALQFLVLASSPATFYRRAEILRIIHVFWPLNFLHFVKYGHRFHLSFFAVVVKMKTPRQQKYYFFVDRSLPIEFPLS